MPITARRCALRDKTRPSGHRHIGLATMETLLTLVWTLLLGAVTRLLTGFYLHLLPFMYIISASMVAWLESPVSASRTNPLSAFGLVEASTSGKSATQWQTLFRVLLTTPLMLCVMIGFVPLLSGGRSVPEILSRTRIVPLNPALDPRSPVAIRRAENRIRVMVRSYTVFSLAIAALILLVPVRLESILDRPVPARSDSGLTAEDQGLLEIYLDLSTSNPDEVEYHVRLASLYYRNGMEDDLRHELSEVRRLDPDHAILMLEEEYGEGCGFVFPEPDSVQEGPSFYSPAPVPTLADSGAVAADTAASPADTLATLLPAGADTLAAADSLTAGGQAAEDSSGPYPVPDTLVLPDITPPPAEIVPGPIPAGSGAGGGQGGSGAALPPPGEFTPDGSPE
jgi:hypothetical protein